MSRNLNCIKCVFFWADCWFEVLCLFTSKEPLPSLEAEHIDCKNLLCRSCLAQKHVLWPSLNQVTSSNLLIKNQDNQNKKTNCNAIYLRTYLWAWNHFNQIKLLITGCTIKSLWFGELLIACKTSVSFGWGGFSRQWLASIFVLGFSMSSLGSGGFPFVVASELRNL